MSYITNIEKETLENTNFRKVLYTTNKSQLVVMSLKPNEDIGLEAHEGIDQFIRIEQGQAEILLNGEKNILKADEAVVISSGTQHNVTNISENETLKLYSIYTPAEHEDGVLHKTKEEADLYEIQKHK